MTILDSVSLEVLLGAMVSVEDRLQAVAQAHGQGMIERLQTHYQHPVDLGAEPYVPFLVSTYALQFYKTLNRMGKIGKKQPKARRRGKKAVGFAFPVRGGHILVKAFDPNKDLAPQVQRRIALEQARMEERFKQGLDGYRQETLGIEQYIWRTMDDGKVRALHRQYDDRRFSWDNPPADGHPGDAFGCRCTAEPVLPDILPLDPDPPEISDEDWAALAQEVALTLALTVLAAYTGGAATPLLLARAARLAARMRGAYRVAGRLMEKIKDPTAREGFKQRQASLQKAIEKVEQRIKEVEGKNTLSKNNLTSDQLKNFQRFRDKFSKEGVSVKITRENEKIIFRIDVPAKNILGSFARYEKTIDLFGNTESLIKTTFDGEGQIVHIKVK